MLFQLGMTTSCAGGAVNPVTALNLTVIVRESCPTEYGTVSTDPLRYLEVSALSEKVPPTPRVFTWSIPKLSVAGYDTML